MVWSSYRSGNYDLWYRTGDGTNWSPALQLTTDPGGDYSPAITRTTDGKMRVVWNRYSEVYYVTTPDGGATWSPETSLVGCCNNYGHHAQSVSGGGKRGHRFPGICRRVIPLVVVEGAHGGLASEDVDFAINDAGSDAASRSGQCGPFDPGIRPRIVLLIIAHVPGEGAKTSPDDEDSCPDHRNGDVVSWGGHGATKAPRIGSRVIFLGGPDISIESTTPDGVYHAIHGDGSQRATRSRQIGLSRPGIVPRVIGPNGVDRLKPPVKSAYQVDRSPHGHHRRMVHSSRDWRATVPGIGGPIIFLVGVRGGAEIAEHVNPTV